MIVWEDLIVVPTVIALMIFISSCVLIVLVGTMGKRVKPFVVAAVVSFVIMVIFFIPLKYSGYTQGGTVTAIYDEAVVAEFEGVLVALPTTDLDIEIGDTIFVFTGEDGVLRITEFRRKE